MSRFPLRSFPGSWGSSWPPDPTATHGIITQPWSIPTSPSGNQTPSTSPTPGSRFLNPKPQSGTTSPMPASAPAAAAVDEAFIWQSAATACSRQGQLLLLGHSGDGVTRLALLRHPQLQPAWRAARLGASWARSDASLGDMSKVWPPLHDRRSQLRRAEQHAAASTGSSSLKGSSSMGSSGSAKTDGGLPGSSSWPGKGQSGVRAKVSALRHRVADALSDAANELHLNELKLAVTYPYPPLNDVLASPATPVEPGHVTSDEPGLGDGAARVLGAVVGLVVGNEGGERFRAALASRQGSGSADNHADAASLTVERSG